MTDSNRRSFLKHTAAASAATATWAWTGGIHAAGANERLTVGVIGCGGCGAGLAEEFAGLADVAYVCDPDESRCRKA
jgi:2-keto-3-deoxy-6-phosphogluconate aldolase